MSCPGDSVLVELLEGGLPPARLAGLEAHVDGCAHCRETVAVLAQGSREAALAATATPEPAYRPSDLGIRALALGAVVGGRYTIGEILGAGAMGTVYRAHDGTLGRDVALKLHRHSADKARTRREAVAMAQLAHPNVVAVFEVGQVAGRDFVAMEYVRGTTLAGWLKARPRPWREVVAMLVAAGEGLAAAHALGLVHRDFKPANVLVGEDGRPRVSDFGLVGGELGPGATAPLAAATTDVTATGAILGTPAYMAPEQFDGQPADARSDQFAFAVAAWEALCGERPFAGATMAALHEATTQQLLRPWRGPSRLRRIVARGLAVDPAARYPSVAALLAALQRAARPRRWRVVGIGAALAATAGAAALIALPRLARARHAAACDDEARTVAALVDDQAAARIERAFVATGAPDAAATARRATPVLRRAAAALADATRGACLVADGGELAAARRACREARQGELAATVAGFVAAERGTVARAVEAAYAITVLAPCADARTAPPPSSALPAERQALAAAHAALETGVTGPALAALPALRRSALSRGDRGTALDAMLAEGLLAAEAEDAPRAIAALQDAEATAEALGRDGDAGGALVGLASVLGLDQHDYEASARAAALAHAKLTRAGVGGVLLVKLLRTEAQVESDGMHVLEAEVRLRAALTLAIATYGADHPEVGRTAGVLSSTLHTLGRDADAVIVARQALAALEGTLGPDAYDVAGARMTLAQALTGVGRLDEARAEFARADASLAVSGHPVPRAALAGAVGTLELAAGQPARAVEAIRRELALLEGSIGAASPQAASAHGDLSRLYLAEGDAARARAEGEAEVRSYEASLGATHPAVANGLTDLAAAELALGHPAAAVPLAERALTLVTPGQSDETQLVLARALWGAGGDRARARALATRAAAAGVADAAAWLAAHPR